MRAGELRHVVEVQRRDETRATTGGSTPKWVPESPVVTRRCSIEPLSVNELVRAAQAQIRATTKITMRYVKGLTEKHSLVQTRNNETIRFNIESVIDTDQMHREHVVLVVRAA